MKDVKTYNYSDLSNAKQNVLCPMNLTSEVCFDDQKVDNWDLNIINQEPKYSTIPIWQLFKQLEKDKYNPYFKFNDIDNKDRKITLSKILKAYYKNIDSDDFNIIAIPNKSSQWGQENILNSINHNVRNNIKLVWKDVAQAIAYCENLDNEEKRKRSNRKLHVLDWTDSEISCSTFELELEEKHNKLFLVPVRKNNNIYQKGIDSFQEIIAKMILKSLKLEADSVVKRYLIDKNHIKKIFILDKKNNCIVPINTIGWKKLLFDKDTINEGINRGFNNIKDIIDKFITSKEIHTDDTIILTGTYFNIINKPVGFIKKCINKKSYSFDNYRLYNHVYLCSQFLTSKGLKIYGERIQKDLPTYYDYLRGLNIVVQNLEKEEIIEKELIKEGRIAGNEKFEVKEPVKGIFIEKYNDSIKFFLKFSDNEKLKTIKQSLGFETDDLYNLNLFPEMKAASGHPKVKVENKILFKNKNIWLDWRQMADSEKTIKSLQNEIKRSFPPYIPAVTADKVRWNEFLSDLNYYLKEGSIGLDDDFFSHLGSSSKPEQFWNSNSEDALKRINVFGADKNESIPVESNNNLLTKFYFSLHRDFRNNDNDIKIKRKVIRAIGWTYQHDEFPEVVNELLLKIKDNKNLNIVEINACSHLFTTQEEIQLFINMVLREFRKRGTRSMGNYINGLRKLISYQNKAFENINTEICNNLVLFINNLFVSSVEKNNPMIFKNSAMCILFILKRRKYDPSFLKYNNKKNDELVCVIINNIEQVIQERKINHQDKNILQQILKFIKGNGTLEGMVAIQNATGD